MKKTLKQLALILVVIAVLLPIMAHAQVVMNPELKPEFAANITPPEGANRAGMINILLQLAAGALIYAAGPIAVLMIAVGGFRYVVARGDQTQMEEAKKTITWAIIGLFVIIVSWAIVTNVIATLQGTDIIEQRPDDLFSDNT